MNIPEPHAMPTVPIVSGRTNMDEPTVFPVTRRDADKTLPTEPNTSEFGTGILVNGSNDSSIGATYSSVDADNDVRLLSGFLVIESFSAVADAGFISLAD
jgi:hypothetical protein